MGAWPLLLDDETRSLESSAGHLELSAHAWPFGTARIGLTVEKSGDGSRIVMDEHAETPPFAWAPDEVQRIAMAPRLRECLHRLALLAENGAG